MTRLKLTEYKEVIDFMHARQSMNEVIALIDKYQFTEADKKVTKQKIYDLLWEGGIKGIENHLIEFFAKKRRDKNAALKKLRNYFGREERFAYSALKKAGHPIGSGTVESAIRRVINMKLKSNGIFWLQNNCERMLYLRCQFLTGRWITLQNKLDELRLNFYKNSGLYQKIKAA